MCFSSSADSRIGKVDQDGQIGIWKKEHNVKDFFFLGNYVFTKTFLSQTFSNQDC